MKSIVFTSINAHKNQRFMIVFDDKNLPSFYQEQQDIMGTAYWKFVTLEKHDRILHLFLSTFWESPETIIINRTGRRSSLLFNSEPQS